MRRVDSGWRLRYQALTETFAPKDSNWTNDCLLKEAKKLPARSAYLAVDDGIDVLTSGIR